MNNLPLTKEKKILNMILDVWYEFTDLPNRYENETKEFYVAINTLSRNIKQRINNKPRT